MSKEEDWPSSPVRIEKDLDSGETMSISHAPKQAEKDTGKLVRMVITELVESVKTVTANVAWEIVMLSWNPRSQTKIESGPTDYAELADNPCLISSPISDWHSLLAEELFQDGIPS